MIKSICFFCVGILMSNVVTAQSSDSTLHKFNLGIEMDVFKPTITGPILNPEFTIGYSLGIIGVCSKLF